MTGRLLPFLRENSWFWGVNLVIIGMKLSTQRSWAYVRLPIRELFRFTSVITECIGMLRPQ